MSRFRLPDRKVVLTRNAQGEYDTTTQFQDGRTVDNICLHNWSPCECDRRTEERLLREFLETSPDWEKEWI